MDSKNKYNEENFREVILKSINYYDTCRNLNIKTTYGNRQTVKKYIELYNIDIFHFYIPTKNGGKQKKSISEVLVENMPYGTTKLKNRLYKEGLKQRKCELCGQGETWNNMKISLILDHINGINDDNRIENLRIVCPNCNAGLDTHGGKNNKNKLNYKLVNNNGQIIVKEKFYCKCGKEILEKNNNCFFCSKEKQRKIKDRPDIETLLSDVKNLGYFNTGKKYGVSDNSIRKWIKFYGVVPPKKHKKQ